LFEHAEKLVVFYSGSQLPKFNQVRFLISPPSGGADCLLHRDIQEEGCPLFKWTIRFRWKGQTIEIEIEIGLNL